MNRDDTLWKAILEDVFDDFLRFFYPNSDEIFDFEKGFEYLDKELEQLFPPEHDQFMPRYVDKLVKVFTKEGTEEWILIHIEVQGYTDKHFAERMFQYYYRIFDKYRRPISAFAIFTEADKLFIPYKFERQFLGTTIIYTFNTYKIIEQSEDDLVASSNPFALVVLTVKAALSGKQMGEQKLFDLKVNLAKQMLSKQMPKWKIRSLMNFLRYYIRFENTEMTSNFEKEVEVITQKNTTMGIEEFLLDRARKEGIEKGKKEGRHGRNIEIAKQMKDENIAIESISRITGLSIDEIKKL